MTAGDLDLLRAFVLLTTDPQGGKPVRLVGSLPGTAGAALLELAAQGAVRVADRRIHLGDGVPADPLLRAVRENLRGRRRAPKVGSWIGRFGTRGAAQVRAQVLGELALAGVVRAVPGRRRRTYYPHGDPGPAQALDARLRAVVAGADDQWAAVLHQLLVAAAGPAYLPGDGPSRHEIMRQVRGWQRERYPDETVRVVVRAVGQAANAAVAGA